MLIMIKEMIKNMSNFNITFGSILAITYTIYLSKTGGLIWIDQWNSLQHSVASAFLAVLYSDYMFTSQTQTLYCSGKLYKPIDLRKFAISQVCIVGILI